MTRSTFALRLVVAFVLCAALSPRLAFGQEVTPSELGAPDDAREPVAGAGPDLFGPALMMGLGGGTFALGLVVHLLGIADRNAVEGAPVGTPWDEVADRAARAPALIGVGQLLMGTGLVIVAGGATWLVLALFDDEEASPEARAVHLEVGPAGATLRGRF